MLTGLVTLILVGSAVAKIVGSPPMVDALVHAGIRRGAIVPIAALELTCLALYLNSRSKILGAVLLTGYFGGATVTHLIGGENLLPPLFVGLLIWAGAYLDVPEIGSFLPWRMGGVSGHAYEGNPSVERSAVHR
jgi:DoxX-like protein